MSFKLFKKTVSIIALITFITTNSIYAAPDSKSIFKNKKVDYQKISNQTGDVIQKKKAILNGDDANQAASQQREAQRILSSHLSDISLIHLPPELGRIVEVHQAEGSKLKAQGEEKLIVHIQDLHTNPEAEMNLAKILELLLNDYKMGLVCSEGAAGPLDTKEIANFPDYAAREKVGRIFVNAGELTGEEYLAITKYPDIPIWGIETESIYFKNIIDFNKIMKFNPGSQVFISQAKKALEELKTRVYTKELLDLDQKEADYKAQKLETADYISYLTNYIGKFNIPLSNYKNISLLTETMSKEKSIDQLKVMSESQNLLLNLQSSLAAKSLRSDSDSLMANAKLFKDQKMSPFAFYSYIKDLAQKHLKDDFAVKYPNLNSFADYLGKVNSIDSTDLFLELENLNFQIKETLSRTDEQKTLVKALRNINFLEGFFNLKVSNEELDYYLNNRDSHKVAFFESFMKTALKKYNISVFVDYNASLIDPHLTELEEFYKVVKERDLAMVTNSLSEIEKRNSKVSTLIAGGFHTKGITKLLKEKGYSYIVVSPYSKTDINEENYHFLMTGQRRPIEELLNQLDVKEIINRFIVPTLRVPLASNTQLVNDYNRDVAPVLAQLTGMPVDKIIIQPGTGRAALLLSLSRGGDKWQSNYVYEIKHRQDGTLVERFIDTNGTAIYVINRDGIFYSAKEEAFKGISLAAKPVSGNFVALKQPAAKQPYQTVTALASNGAISRIVAETGVDESLFSNAINQYASIHEIDKIYNGFNLSIARLGEKKIIDLVKDPVLTDETRALSIKYIAFGKGSTFLFWSDLSNTQKQNLIAQLKMIDLDSVERLYKDFILDNKAAAKVDFTEDSISIPTVVDITHRNTEEYEKALKEGENAFRQGKVCYLELAGGSGARLKYGHAKIMYKASQIMNMSLARMKAKKIRAIAEEYGKPVPWVIMTSDITDKEIQKFFKERIKGGKYFGEIPVSWVKFLRQRVMPQITNSGEFILNHEKDSIVVGGFGHGDARDYVLKNQSVIKWLNSFGIEYVVMVNVDNAYIPSAESIGYHINATKDLPAGVERMSVHSVEKVGPGEKVGMNVLLDGRSAVVEYNQVPDELLYMTYIYILEGQKIVFIKDKSSKEYKIMSVDELKRFNGNDIVNRKWVTDNLVGMRDIPEDIKINYSAGQYTKEILLNRAKLLLLLGNTNGLIWSLESFTNKEHPLPELPVVVAKNKAVDGYNPETGIYHSQEQGDFKVNKFESMAFHGFFHNPVMGAFILVPREGYFAPIKEAEGTDTPDRARQIFGEYDSSLLTGNSIGWTVESDAIVELSPGFAFLDGRYLPDRLKEKGFVGSKARLYLSGRDVKIGYNFHIQNERSFILRLDDEYSKTAKVRIGDNVKVEADVSIEMKDGGSLVIDDNVIIAGYGQQYTIERGAVLHFTNDGPVIEDKKLASNEGMVPGRIDLKKGPADTKWWEQAAMLELEKNPTPWGNDPIVPVETNKGVLQVTLTSKMFENWSPENPEGRDLDISSNKYDEIGPLAIAGIRHVMNISNLHDTRQVKNDVERYLTSAALALMIKIKYNKGAGFPYLANYGHEVRYLSNEFQDITVRTLAAMGFVCNVVPGGITAIWNTFSMGKFFCIPISFCGTASHSPSVMDGLKLGDYEASQFLIVDIESLIAIKKAIVNHVKEKGRFTFTLAAENDPRITDQLYRSTNNGMRVYREYQEKAAADNFTLDLIRNLDASRVHIDCMHGSGYRTLTAFFKEMGLDVLTDKIGWMHTEERSDFGNIGKLLEDPKTGKPKLYDLGADGTQMFEKVVDGKIIKYFPVLCTADYQEKMAAMPIGDVILSTDMDNDRLYCIQILPNDEHTRALLDEVGIVYNVLSNEKLAAVFIPNKFFHFLHEMNFQRIVKLMEIGKISKDRTIVVVKTLASTPAVDQWVEARQKEGYKIEVINTAVGFAKLANIMYRTEGFMRQHPGEDVIISDATGKDINIGKDPIVLAAWEESGGIITGITYGYKDLLGNSFLAQREKSATESIFLSLALMSKLQGESKNGVNLAAYLKELYDRDHVTTPIDLRYDNPLYVPAATKESAIEEMEGNKRKNRIFGAYLSIVIAKMNGQINMDEVRGMLKDIFKQEYDARKAQGQLEGVLLERFQNVNFDALKDVWFTGDGVMFVFEKDADKWFILFRPSGTEPKLKAYGFGKDTNRLAIDAWSFGFNENVAGQLPQSFTGNPKLMEIWGEDGLKAVDKARRMQGAWEDYGRVIDPQDLNAGQMAELEQRKLVRTYSPPDNHLELVNQWLKARGLPEVNIDFSKPQAMPQAQIVELLEAIPPDVFNKLGNSKESVLQKERVSIASNAGISRKQQVDDMEQIIAVPAENIIGHEAGFEKWIAGQPQNMAVVILAMPDEEQAVQRYKDIAWIKVVGKDISEEFRAKLIDLRALYGKEEFFGGFKLGTVNTIDDYKAVAGSIASGV